MLRVITGAPSSWENSSKTLALATRYGQLYICFITAQSAFIFRDSHELIQIISDPFDQQPISCVAFDRRTGQLALSSGIEVKIYDELYTFTPRAQSNEENPDEGEVHISWVYGRGTSVAGTSIKSLSWGIGAELLVANDKLLLYRPSNRLHDMRNTWSFPLATEVEKASFSPDASLVASYGRYDRLVKVWRRLSDRVSSTGETTSDFDFVYLPHSRRVIDVKWRQPFHEDLLVDNILYSTSDDAMFRAWASDIPHDSHILTCHETVPLACGPTSPSKIAVVLDDDVFSWALAKATKRGFTNEAQKQAQELLKNISAGRPEVLLTFKSDGTMDAYSLSDLGSRSHKKSGQRLLLQSQSTNLSLPQDSSATVWMMADIQRVGDSDVLLFLGFPDHIDVYQAELFDIFSKNPIKFEKLSSLGGHIAQICKLNLCSDSLLASEDVSGSVKYWKAQDDRIDEVASRPSEDVTSSTPITLPSFVQAAIPDKVVHQACSDSVTAIVTVSHSKQVQVWGSAAITSFSGAPVSRFDVLADIIDLSWSSKHEPQYLALCTTSKLIILQHKNLLHDSDQVWSFIWTFDLSSLNVPMLSHVVFPHTDLVVASAGSQLYSFSSINWRRESAINHVYETDLPIYHPEFLHQLIRLGDKLNAVRRILAKLHDQLVDSPDSTSLEYDLGLSDDEIFAAEPAGTIGTATPNAARYSGLFDNDDSMVIDDRNHLSKSKATSLIQLLGEFQIAGLTADEKSTLQALTSALVKISADEASLDTMGQRYYLAYTMMQLSNSESAASRRSELCAEDVLCATRSQKQDILLTLVKSSVAQLTWQAARSAKIFLWLREHEALSEVAETIAKAEFLKDEMRDPISASIWYLALHKKNTLLSLWRMSGTHPEHNLTSKILANDFEETKWKTTANKNAYALIGRRRFEYAAAWFLLAGSLKDAVQLCIRKVEDLDLAFAIARIWAKGNNTIVTEILSTEYQDLARSQGSRILACWTYEMLRRQELAMQTLTSPFGLFTHDTPALLSVYEDLRARGDASTREREFIEYITYLLDIRGCHRIAEYVQRTWEYESPHAHTSVAHVREEGNLDEYKARKINTLVEAPKAVFQEPTLDSFAAFDF